MNRREVSVGMAFLPLISMALLVAIGNLTYSIDLKFLLLIASIIAGVVAKYIGVSFDEMLEAYSNKVKKAFPAILILIAIGGVVGTWMYSGTVPMIIYYGLLYLDPKYVIVIAFIVTAIISTFTGTSWGSVATSGVAFIGIATTLGVSLPITAGAVISGAVFGDKISPVSDTTNLTSLSSEVTVYDHIKGMLPNVLIAGFISIVAFTFVGITTSTSHIIPEDSLKILSDLDSIFNFNVFLLIPAAIVFIGGYKGINPLLLMITSSISAVALGVINNGFSLSLGASSMISGFNLSMITDQSSSISETVRTLLNRGGFEGMISGAVLFCFLAMPFGSFMEVSGCLDKMINSLLSFVKSAYSLVIVTFFSGAILNGVTGNGQFSILTIGQIFKLPFEDRKVPKNILSRSMENSMTLLESLLPWHVTAIYMSTTLGVSTLDYLPWAMFNISGIILFFILSKIQLNKTHKNI